MTMEVISAAVTMVVAINPREPFCGGIMNFLGSNGTYDDEHARKMMMMMIRKSFAYLPYLGTYVIMKSLLPPKKELRNMMCTHSLTLPFSTSKQSREIVRNSRTLPKVPYRPPLCTAKRVEVM